MTVRGLTGPDDVLAAADYQPYARFAVSTAWDVTGLAAYHAVAWVGENPYGRIAHVIGTGTGVARLFETAREAGLLDGVRWVCLPRRGVNEYPAGYSHHEDWQLHACDALPEPTDGADEVVALGEDDTDAINDLIDRSMPQTPIRPGHPLVRAFYGIRRAGELVACGADRSGYGEPRLRIGVIGAICVHPEERGQGLGAAISSALARRLVKDYGLVVLGVVAGNDTASRLYARVGIPAVQEITSVRSS